MLQRLIYLLGLILFHILFWKEGIGLNMVIFTLELIVFQRKRSALQRVELYYAIPYLLSVVGVLFVGTNFSIVALIILSVTYLGYLTNRQTSALENFANSLLSVVTFSKWDIAIVDTSKYAKIKLPFGRVITITIIPLVILVLFYSFFVAGNPVFEHFHKRTFAHFIRFVEDINFIWVMFMLLGLVMVRWGTLKYRNPFIQINPSDVLLRTKTRPPGLYTDLKREYQIAVVTFASLNALFLLANLMDVYWVWFQFDLTGNISLKEIVHEGVGWLIAITILSAGMLLYFFRKNLNFFPNNKWLVRLAVIWTIQNIVLAISVAIRTYHYIGFHGLAPKRIGVIIFLIIIATALVGVSLKIRKLKTTAWVTRLTSLVGIGTLAVCAIIPWNRWIASVNINHSVPHEIDVDYYLALGPQAYPYLLDHLGEIEQQYEAHSHNERKWVYLNIDEFKYDLHYKCTRFMREYESTGWPSWTPAKNVTYMKLRDRINE